MNGRQAVWCRISVHESGSTTARKIANVTGGDSKQLPDGEREPAARRPSARVVDREPEPEGTRAAGRPPHEAAVARQAEAVRHVHRSEENTTEIQSQYVIS